MDIIHVHSLYSKTCNVSRDLALYPGETVEVIVWGIGSDLGFVPILFTPHLLYSSPPTQQCVQEMRGWKERRSGERRGGAEGRRGGDLRRGEEEMREERGGGDEEA